MSWRSRAPTRAGSFNAQLLRAAAAAALPPEVELV
jgi:hypothetical protein